MSSGQTPYGKAAKNALPFFVLCIRQKVGGKRIYEVARRVYAALLHYAGQRIYARTARTWNKENGIDIFIIFKPTHLYCVAAVNDNHDIVEIIIEIAYYAKFYRIRFKVVL